MLLLVILDQLLQNQFGLQTVVKQMQLLTKETTHMALEVANWLPGVVIGVLPSLPLHQVLGLA